MAANGVTPTTDGRPKLPLATKWQVQAVSGYQVCVPCCDPVQTFQAAVCPNRPGDFRSPGPDQLHEYRSVINGCCTSGTQLRCAPNGACW